jgi:hypothetical protein
MTTAVPAPDWKHLGSTSNAEFYEIEPKLMAIVPHPNCTDSEASARESVTFQDRHWKAVGHRGAIACFMDNIVVQDGGARAVYVNETQNTLTTCYALVGETFFGKMVSAVFTGLAQPTVPTQIFPSLDAARSWIDQMNKERG